MKRILSGVLAFAMIFGGMSYSPVCENMVITANASETGTYESFTYTKHEDIVEITGCDESATEVIIPSEIDGLPVKWIGDSAFRSCSSLTSVTIPDSVTSIGLFSFYGCSLTEITIPKSVTSIGMWPFYCCLSLTDINVDSDNANYSSIDGVLFNKDATELIVFPNGKTETEYTIPDTVTSIEVGAFEVCYNLTNITIPNSVTDIEGNAFSNCISLTEITIPESVTSIDAFAFEYCNNLTEVTILNPVCEIHGTAFSNGTIYGYDNSTAQLFAEEYGMEFVSLGEAPEELLPKQLLGDVDLDGFVNSSDASLVLSAYAVVATGGESPLEDIQKSAGDVNYDGAIDSSDASSILAYYAYIATGGEGLLEDFLG